MKRNIWTIALWTLLFLARCAQVAPPSGGPKDTEPPKVVQAIPRNGTVNFQGKGFILEFDEYIRTQGLQRELIISPPMEEDPEILVDGKKLRVEWEEELKADQTYSFRFGASVQDITEGNRTRDLVYVLSTGDRLDSLHYEGKVLHARDLTGAKGVLVMLYKDLADSVPRTQRPFYFSRTDEEGHFDIPYLAKGEYKLFALNDQNRNQLFDLPNEAVGFKKEPVVPYPADSSGDATIRLFEEEGEEQFLEEREVRPGRTVLKLKKEAEKAGLRTLEGDTLPWDHFHLHRAGSDSLSYWFVDPEMPDSVELALHVDGDLLDSLQVRSGVVVDDQGSIALSPLFEDPLDLYEEAGFGLEAPLSRLDPERIRCISDSDTVALSWRIGGKERRKLLFEREDLGEKNEFSFLPGAVRDTFGRTNDSMSYGFSLREAGHYGGLSLLPLYSGEGVERILVSLLDEQGQTFRKKKGRTGELLKFEHLDPGGLGIELILDFDSNGRWTTGKYPERQPEPVLFYPDTVEIRSGWEQEIEWKGIR